MKVYLGVDLNRVGGGWTFARNLVKSLKGKVEFVDSVEECDLFLIPGSTMVDKEEVYRAHEMGKRIILRVDNAVRDSRNRGTGMSRLKSYAEKADKIVYQSKWAREYLQDFLNKSGSVIYNGVDKEIFKPEGQTLDKENETYLYTRFNRDETKCWHEAYYKFQCLFRENTSRELWIVGNFSDTLREYNFDFFNSEKIKYWGVMTEPEAMAMMYRTVDYIIYPYFNDACSNTLLEAKACGTKIMLTGSGATGGSKEILNMQNVYDLDKMSEKYFKVMKEVCL